MSQINTNNQSITDFITEFKGGTRSNRFRVNGSILKYDTNRLGSSDQKLTNFHIRSASLPASIIGAIPVNYRGRTVFYPGDRSYQPWNITVLDDRQASKNHTGRQNTKTLFDLFHDWHRRINDHQSNTDANKTNKPLLPDQHFATDWHIEQLDTNGRQTPLRRFDLKHCWPAAIGPLEFDMSQDNTLMTFSVTLLYSHYEIIPTSY